MAELILEPYAVLLHWRLPAVDGRWEAVLSEYLETLAQGCQAAGACVIGHIKALALFPGGRYLRVSVVSPTIPAGVEGDVPAGCMELTLALNLIVYGLEQELVEKITLETAINLAAQWQGEVIIEKTSTTSTHKHEPVSENAQNAQRRKSMSDQLATAISDLEEAAVAKLVQERLDAGEDPLAILASCREGMALIGKRFESCEYYVSELIMAGEIFKQANALLAPHFKAGSGKTRGSVVVGTVKGDIHDIGKDLVVSMLKAANYDVTDLGVDVPPEKFVEAVKNTGSSVVGLSGLLTVGFESMKETVTALDAAGLRPKVKVMIGGGSVTEQVRTYAGADAMGADAQMAVTLCNQWIGG
jgi:methanogenic corrinoid protein MtbC1